MTVYLTKVWGFGAPVGPLQFSTSGWRDNARGVLKEGDTVILVGTKGVQTPDEMQGRLLGLMEPSSNPVMALDFITNTRATDYVDGEYKWPYGLMNHRAWSFPTRPLLTDISTRKFSMDSAQGIVQMTDEEAAAILALPKNTEELLRPTAQAKARLANGKKGGKRSSPSPTTRRAGVMHMRRAEAHTYVMEIVGAKQVSYKIGWAFDYKLRADQFNHASMPDLGGLLYKPLFFHLWDTAKQAFLMEQRLLEHFDQHRHGNNHEIVTNISRKQLDAAWYSGILGKL